MFDATSDDLAQVDHDIDAQNFHSLAPDLTEPTDLPEPRTTEE
jgi:hypothetical protein